MQLACFPHPALVVARTLHRAKKFLLRHLREKPLLHLDVLRKIRHVLRKWRVKLATLGGHGRGLSANHPTASPIVQGWAHPTLLLHELIVKRSFASFSLHLHQTNLLLPFELLELELFLQFHQLLSLLSFALFLELEKLSLLLLLLHLEQMDLMLLLLLMRAWGLRVGVHSRWRGSSGVLNDSRSGRPALSMNSGE